MGQRGSIIRRRFDSSFDCCQDSVATHPLCPLHLEVRGREHRPPERPELALVRIFSGVEGGGPRSVQSPRLSEEGSAQERTEST